MAKVVVVVFTAYLLFGLGQAHAGGQQVTAAEYGEKWPFTVTEGHIRCEPVNQVLFQSPDGARYAVNGTAMGQRKKRGYRDVAEIWKDDPKYPELGLKINIGWVIEKGLALCK